MYNFIYLFMSVLSLPCCTCFSLAVASRGYTLVAGCRLLSLQSTALGASGLQQRRPWAQRVQLLGSRAQDLSLPRLDSAALCRLWDLPGSGLKSVPPALAGGFFTTEPPGKPLQCILDPLPSDRARCKSSQFPFSDSEMIC